MKNALNFVKQIFIRGDDIPLILVSATATLAVGLYLPIITIKQLVFWKNTFSVLTGIETLYTEGQHVLAVVVFLFSIVFPIGKLAVLFVLWMGRFESRNRQTVLKWLTTLGKWSMMDVFIVSMTIVIAKISALADAHACAGIYYFGGSVLLSMAASIRMHQVGKK